MWTVCYWNANTFSISFISSQSSSSWLFRDAYCIPEALVGNQIKIKTSAEHCANQDFGLDYTRQPIPPRIRFCLLLFCQTKFLFKIQSVILRYFYLWTKYVRPGSKTVACISAHAKIRSIPQNVFDMHVKWAKLPFKEECWMNSLLLVLALIQLTHSAHAAAAAAQ